MSDLSHQSLKAPMTEVISRSLKSFFHPEVLKWLIWPMVGSGLVVALGLYFSWGFVAQFFSGEWSGIEQSLVSMSGSWGGAVQKIMSALGWMGPFLLLVLMIIVAMPLILTLNIVLISIIASTVLVKTIGRLEYPDIQWKGSPRLQKSLWNSISGVLIFLSVWFLTLPLWLIPGLSLAVPLILNAWLNRRVCLFDSSTDVADEGEFQNLKHQLRRQGFLLGLMTAGLNYIPLAFLVTPVLTMIAFIHLVLMTIQLNRSRLIN